MDVSSQIKDVLKKHPTLLIDGDKKKIRCSLSGHEMQPSVQSLESYVSGKKYKKLKEKQEFESELDKYKEHIVPSNKKHCKHQMFCKLTLRHMNREPHHIRQHIQGRRFQKALDRWKECQETGEVFKPRGGPLKKAVPGQEEEEMFASDESVMQDDLSDLYPEADFAEESPVDMDTTGAEEAESDEEFQDLSDEEQEEEKPVPSSSNNTSDQKKRKLKGKADNTSQSSKKQKVTHKKKNKNKKKK